MFEEVRVIGAIENVSSYEEILAQAEADSLARSDMQGQDTFIKLLVTQMQYQDPLNPQSNHEFVAQLAQFTALEQLMGVNDKLASLYSATAAMNNASMTQLLGRQVVAYGDSFEYSGTGGKELHFEVMADTATATLTVLDEDGKVVARKELGALDQGESSWTWDGTNVHGNPIGEGTYTFKVTAKDSSGNEVFVNPLLVGEVDEMSYVSGTPTPSIDGTSFSIANILRVETSGRSEEETSE
jgi:flagellar basal-body rod modification protein FlgD